MATTEITIIMQDFLLQEVDRLAGEMNLERQDILMLALGEFIQRRQARPAAQKVSNNPYEGSPDPY